MSRGITLARALIHQGHRVLYREAHVLLDELADAALAGTRRERMTKLAAVLFLIIDDLAMRRLPGTAAEDLPRAHPAPLRGGQHTPHLESAGRGLGQNSSATSPPWARSSIASSTTPTGSAAGPRSWRMKEHASRQPPRHPDDHRGPPLGAGRVGDAIRAATAARRRDSPYPQTHAAFSPCTPLAPPRLAQRGAHAVGATPSRRPRPRWPVTRRPVAGFE